MAVWFDYKPTRYEGKGFLHRDITGEMWFGGNEDRDADFYFSKGEERCFAL